MSKRLENLIEYFFNKIKLIENKKLIQKNCKLKAHFLNPDSLLNVRVFTPVFICPDIILGMIGIFELAVEFFLSSSGLSLFYVFNWKDRLLFVTVFGLFNLSTLTIVISFFTKSLLKSLWRRRLVRDSTVMVLDLESFLPSYLSVFVFFKIKTSFCLILSYSTM